MENASSSKWGLRMNNEPLVTVEDLNVHFSTEAGTIKAVNGVSFEIRRAETLGVVGESGCGKSVTALAIMNMISRPAGKLAGGKITYFRTPEEPVDISALEPNSKSMRMLRGAEISMIFQEPMSSLTPVYSVGKQIVESLILENSYDKKKARVRAIEMLRLVGISPPEQQMNQFPHQLSGGMRQRVMIAMALCRDPKLLIADEPTTALDVTIEAQILDLLRDMRKRFGMSLMIITHDLGVISEMADRVAVMYMGNIVETAPCSEILTNPAHPYTKGLMKSIPTVGRKGRLHTIRGSVPSPLEVPRGCSFSPRCDYAMNICRIEEPPEFVAGPEHSARCWLLDDKELEA